MVMRRQEQVGQQQRASASTPTLHSLQEAINELRKDMRELRAWLVGLFITIVIMGGGVGGGVIGVLIAQG